jgi:hypothetical protein
MTPTDQIAESDVELRNVVERAFPETNVDFINAEGEAPPSYRSDDAEAAWKRMYEQTRGREVAVLLEMLDGTWLTGEERWKAVTFLGYSLATPEAAGEREKILAALAVEAIVKQRGSAAADAVRLQGAALDAVARAPLDASVKWQFMLDAIQSSRSYFREIVRRLSGFQPDDKVVAADAYPILLDALVRGDSPADLDSVSGLVRELDVRSAMPDLRRLLLAANSHLSARVAPILAEWGDKEAAFEIRRVINQYSTANDWNVDDLFAALYRLERSACTEYLADVFRSAQPALQEYLIEHSLRAIPSAAIVAAVREVAESTKDVELKNAATAYLENAPEIPVEEELAAAGAGTSAKAAETDTWQPVFESVAEPPKPSVAVTPEPPPPPTTATAAPAAAVAAAAAPAPAGSWQPSSESALAAGADEARSQRLGAEAEALRLIREEAAREAAEREAAAREAAGQKDESSGALEFLVRLPQILFALAVVGAILAMFLMQE